MFLTKVKGATAVLLLVGVLFTGSSWFLTNDGRDVTRAYPVDKGAKIVLANGKKGKLTDLKEGVGAEVDLDAAVPVILKIRVAPDQKEFDRQLKNPNQEGPGEEAEKTPDEGGEGITTSEKLKLAEDAIEEAKEKLKFKTRLFEKKKASLEDVDNARMRLAEAQIRFGLLAIVDIRERHVGRSLRLLEAGAVDKPSVERTEKLLEASRQRLSLFDAESGSGR
jgi:hypothetical protein